MITSKKDAKIVREVVGRLRAGPSISFKGFVPLLGIPTRYVLEIEAEIKRQHELWAEAWLIHELNDLLPDTEKVQLK